MELESRNFTSKEPHAAREPQVADPWSRDLAAVPGTLVSRKTVARSRARLTSEIRGSLVSFQALPPPPLFGETFFKFYIFANKLIKVTNFISKSDLAEFRLN